MAASKPNFAAMTTNERLAEAGLLRAFDDAVNARDRGQLIEILQQVDFEHSAATSISDKVLSGWMGKQ